MLRGRPFPAGVSGNPAGRPRHATAIARYVRELGGENAKAYIDVLHGLATDPRQHVRTRLAALFALLDRGWGRPAQSIELSRATVDQAALATLTDEELEWGLKIAAKLEAASESVD